MGNSEFILIPIPTELLESINYRKDAILEFYLKDKKIVIDTCSEEDVKECLEDVVNNIVYSKLSEKILPFKVGD